MSNYVCIILVGLFVLFCFYLWIRGIWSKAKEYDHYLPIITQLSERENALENKRREWEENLKVQLARFESQKKDWEERVRLDKDAINRLSEEKSKGFPWLAQAYAEYFYLKQLKEAHKLEHKSHPAPSSGQKVREIAQKRRIIEQKLRIAQSQIDYYHNLFPFLDDFDSDLVDEDILNRVISRNLESPIKEIGELDIDPVRVYLSGLSKEEYNRLSITERNQRALDIYWKRDKSNWELGRDYERFVGYQYEVRGYAVKYQGILEGYDDLGRDLICKKENRTCIIQCKRWARHKVIHEKHVNQLYGTFIKYKIDNPNEEVISVLYTSTKLTDRAREFANYLGVMYFEDTPLNEYPSIKCNISRRNNEKIYHLPFDQQYDRTIIEEEGNEKYVATVKQAEDLGFRRAWRWRGDDV